MGKRKIDKNDIIAQYESGVESYARFTIDVGLWASETYVISKYFKKDDRILDLGCGTGRTTFGLYKNGYTNLVGVDLTPAMIVTAQNINESKGIGIDFKIGDATALEFKNNLFDVVFFSFNGIMSIPSRSKRNKALSEIYRVLRPKSKLVFTTHDREAEEEFLEFWEDEKKRWEIGDHDTRLYEYGDLITTSKNERSEIYIHIPSQQEVKEWLQNHGFRLLETFYRSDKFQEEDNVIAKSGECRFWVAEKSIES